jgi:sugar phosphate isomerase/epimerase
VNSPQSKNWNRSRWEAILLSDLYIHLPVASLKKRLPAFIENHWQPELALQTSDLDLLNSRDISELSHQLSNAQLGSCIHAPFFDLNPGTGDPDIRRITERRFQQTIDFAAEVGASRIVFHPGFDPWRYARTPDAWLNNSLEFWPALIDRAAETDILLCLENIFDTQPTPLIGLLQTIDSPHLRHCFDIGHWFLFSKTPLCEWFTQLGPYLSHLHLHDNRGRADDHRPIGKGKIDFPAFVSQLRDLEVKATATLEAHTDKDAKRSLSSLHKLLQT